MYELIELKRDEIFTNSKIIANGTNNKHESIVSIIQKYWCDISDFGKIEFSDFKSGNLKGGRPESENPRKKQLGVRFDDEELRKLDKVAEHYNETRVESIRRGVEKLYSEIKK